MLTVELHLIGEPRLLIGGVEGVIEPRVAFEVFAQIVCEGEDGIARGELARRFWPHLDEKNARQQLRIALHRLRSETSRLGIGEVCSFDDQRLRLLQCVQTDISQLGSKKSWTLSELEPLLCPFAQGWKEAHWMAQRDAAGELIADGFSVVAQQHRSRERLVELLRKAVHLYPTTTKLNSLLVQLLLENGGDVEANEVVIGFEEKWVERFGSGDIPCVMTRVREGLQPRSPTRRTAVFIAGVPAALALLAWCGHLMYSKASADGRVASLLPHLRAQSRYLLNSGGHQYRITPLEERSEPMGGTAMLSDGTYELTLDPSKPSEHVIWQGLREAAPVPEAQENLVDREGQESLWEGKPRPTFFDYRTASQSVVIQGTEDYPLAIAERFVSPGCFLFNRVCGDKEADRRHLCLYQRGVQTAVDFGMGKVQVSVLTAIHDKTIYGKLSFGRFDGWRYHAFTYNLETGRSALLACPPVDYVSSGGDLVALPEDVDVQRGDYSSAWNHQVLLVPKLGSPRFVTCDGQTRFAGVAQLGDALILRLNDHYDWPAFVAINFQGRKLPELTHFLAQAVGLDLHSGKNGFIQLYNPQAGRYSYVWIESVS